MCLLPKGVIRFEEFHLTGSLEDDGDWGAPEGAAPELVAEVAGVAGPRPESAETEVRRAAFARPRGSGRSGNDCLK